MEIETPGTLLLTIMKLLEPLTDDELREVVRKQVASEEERRAYEQLALNVSSHDTLLLLSARALTHEAMRLRHAEVTRRPVA